MQPISLQPGDRLDGRYTVADRLGIGGMSAVYRARDESLGRDVAVKVFPPAIADAGDVVRRRDEVRLLAGLFHPGLVVLFDASLDAQPPYLTMEWVDGESLAERLRRGPLTAEEFEPLAASVAAALAFVHERGIVHRDVKPGNILLPREGAVTAAPAKLADFGIARLIDGESVTATGTLVGTAAYLSPEQVTGGQVGPASDVYALGIVFIECLSGTHPFPGTAMESAAARLSRLPGLEHPALAPWRPLVERMTAREHDRRPTAAEVVDELAGASPTRILSTGASTQPMDSGALAVTAATRPVAMDEIPAREPVAHTAADAGEVDAHPRPRPTRVPALVRRRGIVAALASVVVVVAGIALVLALSTAPPPAPPAPEYPVVDGVLGEHLVLLQESVAP